MLKDNLLFWKDIGASESIIDWVKNGVHLSFNSSPVPYSQANRVVSALHKQFVDSEIQNLLNKGAISPVAYKPLCVSALSCVPKKNKKLRLITDLSPLNEHVKSPYFKNEGIDVVSELLDCDDHLVTVDLKDGFHHVSVHPDSLDYLGIYWNKQYYTWNVLPFGLNCSPYILTRSSGL